MDTNDEQHEIHEFGWWPEIVGAIGVILPIWFLIIFARGSI